MTQPERQQHTTATTPLAGTILDRIESERITPTSRLYFIFSEYTIWTLWTFSVLIGAVALAVMIYVSMQASYAMYEATHESWISLVAEVAPLLWLSVFVVMAGVAYFNLRCTKKGYRYPVWKILLSSLLLSVFGGIILHNVGAGLMIESMLGKTVPQYISFEKRERNWWLRPDEGLLVGQFVPVEAGGAANFKDVQNKEWVIVAAELPEKDHALLQSGELVKVIGMRSTTSVSVFHSCGVFPWMHAAAPRMRDMKEARTSFRKMLDEYKEKVAGNVRNRTNTTTAVAVETATLFHSNEVCMQMPVVERAMRRP